MCYFRCFIISASLELCKDVSNHLFYQVWIIRVIMIQCCDIHRKLCVQMKRSRDLHHTQVLAIFLSAGTLQFITWYGEVRSSSKRFIWIDLAHVHTSKGLKIEYIMP